MILIVVRHLIRPQYADEFPRMVGEFTAATRAEPGTISFEWSRSTDDPAVYFLIEAFRDAAAGEAHVSSSHFKAAIARLPDFLAAAVAPAAAVRGRSEALLAEVLAMGHQQGVFDVVHLEATAAAIGGMGIRVASWYPAPEAGLNPSQLADVYASLALRMAGARQQLPAARPGHPGGTLPQEGATWRSPGAGKPHGLP